MSLMCIHVLFQSTIFVQIAVVFSTVFVQVIIAVWLITIAIMRIAIMVRFGIPMPWSMKIEDIPVVSIHFKVMTIKLLARVVINTATMVTIIVVVLDHNFF